MNKQDRELLDKLMTYAAEGKNLDECLPDPGDGDDLSDREKLFYDIVNSIDVYRLMCRDFNGGHATFVDKLYGTVKGKHKISDENMERFLKSIGEIAAKRASGMFDKKYGSKVLGAIMASVLELQRYFSKRMVYPLETVVVKNIDYRRHLRNLKTNLVDHMHEVSDRNRILDNLRRTVDIDVPGIRIHLLKDLYTINIERGYYQASCRIMQRLAYLDDDRRRVEQMTERLLSLKCTVTKEDGKIRSDLREIRNAFAHPVGIDKGSYYHIRIADDYVVDLYDVDLLFYVFMVEFLADQMDMIVDVMVAVELYRWYWEEF